MIVNSMLLKDEEVQHTEVYRRLLKMKEDIATGRNVDAQTKNIVFEFVRDWLLDKKKNIEFLADIIEVFGKNFTYEGKIWRGVFTPLDSGCTGLGKPYLCFTNYKPVALYHANFNDVNNPECEYGKKKSDEVGNSFLIEVTDGTSFSLDEFMMYLKRNMNDARLKEIIDSFLWENEKIVTNLSELDFSLTKLNNYSAISTDPLA